MTFKERIAVPTGIKIINRVCNNTNMTELRLSRNEKNTTGGKRNFVYDATYEKTHDWANCFYYQTCKGDHWWEVVLISICILATPFFAFALIIGRFDEYRYSFKISSCVIFS